MQHLDVNVLTMHTAHYWLIVTFRGTDSWRGLLMLPRRIVSGDFPLEPHKVTMNHIIYRENDRGREFEVDPVRWEASAITLGWSLSALCRETTQ